MTVICFPCCIGLVVWRGRILCLALGLGDSLDWWRAVRDEGGGLGI
jgi:hypothetical protein